jgi:hypothetical protein
VADGSNSTLYSAIDTGTELIIVIRQQDTHRNLKGESTWIQKKEGHGKGLVIIRYMAFWNNKRIVHNHATIIETKKRLWEELEGTLERTQLQDQSKESTKTGQREESVQEIE